MSTLFSGSNTKQCKVLSVQSLKAIDVISLGASWGLGKPSVTLTSISKKNFLWPFETSSESAYLSTKTRVSAGTSDPV